MKNNQLILLKNKNGQTRGLTSSGSPLTYPELVRKVKEVLTAGRTRAEAAVQKEKARSYWEAGRHIHQYELHGKDRARYGERVIPNLAAEVGLSETVVRDMLSLYRTIPIPLALGELGWSHHQLLLRVDDPKKREVLKRLVEKNDWTWRELRAAIKKVPLQLADGTNGNRAASINPNRKKLIPKKGKFFTYQIVRPQNMHQGPGGYSLDLGFKMRHEIDFKGIRNPRPGEIVQAVRTKEDPAGDRYKVVRPKNLRSDLYTYKAKAQIFRDADTFWVDIDLGFRNWNEQKLRLRGIDAEELDKAGGRKAAWYVKKVLSRVPFIVITISGRDKFGRPLADVFYLEGTEDREKVLREGKFLNQELLDLGLAKQV